MGMGTVYALLRSELHMSRAEVDDCTIDQVALHVYTAQRGIADRSRVQAAYITDGIGRLLGVIKD